MFGLFLLPTSFGSSLKLTSFTVNVTVELVGAPIQGLTKPTEGLPAAPAVGTSANAAIAASDIHCSGRRTLTRLSFVVLTTLRSCRSARRSYRRPRKVRTGAHRSLTRHEDRARRPPRQCRRRRVAPRSARPRRLLVPARGADSPRLGVRPPRADRADRARLHAGARRAHPRADRRAGGRMSTCGATVAAPMTHLAHPS